MTSSKGKRAARRNVAVRGEDDGRCWARVSRAVGDVRLGHGRFRPAAYVATFLVRKVMKKYTWPCTHLFHVFIYVRAHVYIYTTSQQQHLYKSTYNCTHTHHTRTTDTTHAHAPSCSGAKLDEVIRACVPV